MSGIIFDAIVTWSLIKVNGGDISSLISFMVVMCIVTIMRTSWWIITEIKYKDEMKTEKFEK